MLKYRQWGGAWNEGDSFLIISPTDKLKFASCHCRGKDDSPQTEKLKRFTRRGPHSIFLCFQCRNHCQSLSMFGPQQRWQLWPFLLTVNQPYDGLRWDESKRSEILQEESPGWSCRPPVSRQVRATQTSCHPWHHHTTQGHDRRCAPSAGFQSHF